jgi:hypothetical protein
MEYLAAYFKDEIILLLKWQTLLGSIMGVFGSLTVALVIFLLNHFYQKHKEIRESIRKTEIALALGLNDIYDIERHLTEFLRRLEFVVIQPLKNNKNINQYFLNKTNFPSLLININSSLLQVKHSSYYVHNKILIIVKNIGQTNRMFREMKTEYKEILEMARFLIIKGATVANQREEYLINNESFKDFITDTIKQLHIAKRIFAETKAYNLKLLKRQRLSVWRLEGVSFKFFYNKQEIESYKSTLECLDRIDLKISEEVDKLLTQVEKKANSR